MNVFSKGVRIAAILAVAAVSFFWVCPATAASRMSEIEKLAPPRTVVCYFEGQDVADLVVNARGKLTFLCVDSKLAQALSRLRKTEYSSGEFSGIPSQIFAYATKSRRRHVLFVVRVQALKIWDFDSSMISVGGYSIA